MVMERMTMVLFSIVLAIGLLLNFMALSTDGLVGSDLNVTSLTRSNTFTDLNTSLSQLGSALASSDVISIGIFGLKTMGSFITFFAEMFVKIPLDFNKILNKLAYIIAGGNTASPVFLLFQMLDGVVLIMFLFGAFNFVKEIARIVRGGG